MQNSTGVEDYSAGTALSMPFRLLSWEITYYSIRDFSLPPTTSRLGCSEGSAPLPEPPPFLDQEAEQKGMWASGPDFLSGVIKKHPQLVSLEV